MIDVVVDVLEKLHLHTVKVAIATFIITKSAKNTLLKVIVMTVITQLAVVLTIKLI
jgi:hypothetical protein